MKNEILKIFPDTQILFDEPMKKHISFKVGGPANFLLLPENSGDILKALEFCDKFKINYYILGNGSNVLVKDNGFDGMIIKIGKQFSDIELNDDIITAKAGVLLSELANFAMENSFTGLEFASGIPGTLGGAVFMNAGAYGGEMKDIIFEVEVLDIDNKNVIILKNEQMNFGYRKSIIQDGNYIVLSAKIKLAKGDKSEIIERTKELTKQRKEKQPLEFPSAGSTFKRPEGYFAGKLIMDSGLRGAKIGGAMVSEKHCGFVVNYNNATAKDIIELINYIKAKVYENYEVILEPEVRIIGN